MRRRIEGNQNGEEQEEEKEDNEMTVKQLRLQTGGLEENEGRIKYLSSKLAGIQPLFSGHDL